MAGAVAVTHQELRAVFCLGTLAVGLLLVLAMWAHRSHQRAELAQLKAWTLARAKMFNKGGQPASPAGASTPRRSGSPYDSPRISTSSSGSAARPSALHRQFSFTAGAATATAVRQMSELKAQMATCTRDPVTRSSLDPQ